MAEQIVQLQVAKADEADMRAMLDVANIIEAMAKGWMPELQHDDGGEDKPDDEFFDEEDPDHCRHAVAMLLRADERGGLFRAAFGLTVLLNPKNELVDPDLDHIAKHPKIISALATQASKGWQPIETAPKDGTVVDLWIGGEFARREPDCYWGLPHHCCGEMGSLCDSDWHGLSDGWVGPYNIPISDFDGGPTHWMLQPQAPLASEKRGS